MESSNEKKIRGRKVSNDSLKVDSFDNLKTYINHLYNSLKKKE